MKEIEEKKAKEEAEKAAKAEEEAKKAAEKKKQEELKAKKEEEAKKMQDRIHDAMKKAQEKKVMPKTLNADPTLRGEDPPEFDPMNENFAMKKLMPGEDNVDELKDKSIVNPMTKKVEQKITPDANIIEKKKKELLLLDQE